MRPNVWSVALLHITPTMVSIASRFGLLGGPMVVLCLFEISLRSHQLDDGDHHWRWSVPTGCGERPGWQGQGASLQVLILSLSSRVTSQASIFLTFQEG